MDGAALAREYYRSIDEDDYDALAGVVSDGFVHRRPDRTIEGREAFVSFMRSGRPERETTHVVESVYTDDDGDVAVEGRLLDADGDTWFRFVDTFEVGEDGIANIRTYTGPGTE
jgi:ketosteroid isomerase-like protein